MMRLHESRRTKTWRLGAVLTRAYDWERATGWKLVLAWGHHVAVFRSEKG